MPWVDAEVPGLVRKVALVLGQPRPVWRKAEGGLAVRPARCSVFTSAAMGAPSRSVFACHFSVRSVQIRTRERERERQCARRARCRLQVEKGMA